jgi:uncharacterized protein YjbI with pentapeptide repeats
MGKIRFFNWIKRIILSLICLFALFLFYYFFNDISDYLFKGDRGELVKVFLTFIAGIIAMLVWHSGYKRVKVMEKQTEKTGEQIRVMFKGNIDTRFNNAVGHLGNVNPTVVLGGIHALQQIAVEYEDYTQLVHNLFCSFLRENSTKLYKNIDFMETPDFCPVIIQTLIDYLFKPYNNKDNIYKEKGFLSDLRFSTLKNCDFKYAECKTVAFAYCTLENCDFTFTKLTECFFHRATLLNCDFESGNLTDCSFYDNIALVNCDFAMGELIDCNFQDNVTLTNCNFELGTLKNCNFHDNVTMTNCNFMCRKNNEKHIDKPIFSCKDMRKKYVLSQYNADIIVTSLVDCDLKDVKLIDTELPKNIQSTSNPTNDSFAQRK